MARAPIAYISADVIVALGLSCLPNTPVYLGKSNIRHMQERHPADFEKYHEHIADIISAPHYVGINPSNDSIEFVKEFQLDNNEFVKVAVRISQSGTYFARSLYVLNPNRAQNFIRKGTLKDLTNR